MKKQICLLFVFGVVVSGCIISEKGNGEAEDASGDIIGEYMPGKLIGSSYVWKSTLTDSAGGSVTSTHTINVSKTDIDDGHTHYLAYYDSGKLYNRFRIEDDRVYVTADGTIFGLHDDGYPYGSTPNEDYCHFDFGASKGVEQTFLDWGSQTESEYVNYYVKGMYLGPASVTVPAGVFTDCRQFKLMPSIVFTPKLSGNIVSISRVELHWFAKGVGPVKRVMEFWHDGKMNKRITEELVSYTIPE